MRRINPELQRPSEMVLEGKILKTRNIGQAAEILRPLSLRHPSYEKLFRLAVRHLIQINAITAQQELEDAITRAVYNRGY